MKTSSLLVVIAAACSGSGDPHPGGQSARESPPAGPPERIVAVSRGELAACALRAGGTVDCWGRWKAEQPDRRVQRLPGVDDARAVVVGGWAICVLGARGVACSDRDGRLHPVAGSEGVVSLSAGAGWCGIAGDGSVRCWDLVSAPGAARRVGGARQVVQLASTRYGFTCAVERAGTVACRHEEGEFRRVAGLTGVRALALGYDNRPEPVAVRTVDGCAIDGSGVRCFVVDDTFTAHEPWGHDPRYVFQLPARPRELAKASAISLTHADNTLTGNVEGSVVEVAGGARTLAGLSGVHTVTSGCALTSTGEVRCWGSNADGELGHETTSHRFVVQPVEVRGLPRAASIAASMSATWAVSEDGRLFRWGQSDIDGERSSSVPVEVPVAGRLAGVLDLPPLSLCFWTRDRQVACRTRGPAEVVAGLRDTVELLGAVEGLVARRADGSALAWSGGRYDDPVPLADHAAVLRARTGCSLAAGGHIECDAPSLRRPPEVRSVVIPDAVELAGSRTVTCARRRGGEVSCWGGWAAGQLGGGDRDDGAGPREIPGIDNATSVVAGENVVCAIRARGRLTCWGQFQAPGPLSDREAIPILPPTDVIESGVRQVSIGDGHACALLDGGRVRCWGFQAEGELGDGALLRSDDPLPVPGL